MALKSGCRTLREKRCSACRKMLPRSEFNKRRSRPDGLQNNCRVCNAAKSKKHYAKGGDEAQADRNARNRRAAKEMRRLTTLVKEANQCAICSEAEPVTLSFYREGRDEKCVATMVSAKAAWSRILAEMKKCTIVCENCRLKLRNDLIKVPKGKRCVLPDGLEGR